MRRAWRWGVVALAGLVVACLAMEVPGPAQAAQDALDWKVSGDVEVGGMYGFGERSSSRFNNYRDMDNGFLGEVNLQGEKKDWDVPLFFEIGIKNPARDDQRYEGAFGWYGLFKLDLSWDRTPVDLSNSAQTIWQQNDDGSFRLPSTLRSTIATTFTTAPTSPAGRAAISGTINGLLRPVELGYNTDVGKAGVKFTPLEGMRFDVEYMNIRREGKRPIGAQMAGSTAGPIHELAIPIENYTQEVKVGMEYARPTWGLQFNYTGSLFYNEFSGYTWDNPNVATSTAAANASDRVSAAPKNFANTFSLTGTAALPLQTRVNGTFAYTMLRQDQAFEFNTQNPNLAQSNTDDAGNSHPDAKANLVLGNIVLTSRPIKSVTATARYRYFEYQNDTPEHLFTNAYVSGGTTPTLSKSLNERYTKQNVGIDLAWRPISMLNLKGGYEYLHWSRAGYGDINDAGTTQTNFSNHDNIAKFSADMTPVDWFLGRLTYAWDHQTLVGENATPTAALPNAVPYPYAERTSNRVDALFQFTPWETLTPSISGSYAVSDYPNNDFGLTKNDYWSGGASLAWSPVPSLTLTGDFTYEQYNWDMTSRYNVGGVLPGSPFNDWRSKSKDQFYNVGLNAIVDIVPKKFDITLGYAVSFGYTTFQNSNPNLNAGGVTSVPQATAYSWDKVQNVLQNFRFVAKYHVTEKLSLRGGFAYERANERNWATDPMQPFMGNYDSDRPGGAPITQGVQSVYLGATQPNYEAYIVSGFVRYAF